MAGPAAATVAGSVEGGPAVSHLLKVEDVVKAYGDEPVLRGVSFDMDRGDTTVVVGASGSGKSTLLRCVNRLTEVDAGTIVLDGVEVTAPDADVNAIRRDVGMVFQGFNLFAHLTALENVTLGLRRVRGLERAELSGGQQQRVGIARALAMDPKLMLFDEPTSALDPELIGEVLAVMRDLADRGMTMLVVSHEMGFARSAASEMLFLEDGVVLESGPPELLFEAPEHERTREFLTRLTTLEGDG